MTIIFHQQWKKQRERWMCIPDSHNKNTILSFFSQKLYHSSFIQVFFGLNFNIFVRFSHLIEWNDNTAKLIIIIISYINESLSLSSNLTILFCIINSMYMVSDGHTGLWWLVGCLVIAEPEYNLNKMSPLVLSWLTDWLSDSQFNHTFTITKNFSYKNSQKKKDRNFHNVDGKREKSRWMNVGMKRVKGFVVFFVNPLTTSKNEIFFFW